MRVFLFMILFAGLAMPAWAACETSTLEVHTYLQRPIKVYVDGKTGANPPTVNVIISGITPGMHHVQVVQVRTDRYGRRVNRTVYNGSIDVRPSVYMDARVDEGQGIAIHNTPLECGGQFTNNTPQPSQANSAGGIQSSPPVAAPIPPHMSDAEFKKVIAAIKSSKYETKKLDTLQAVIGTAQVATDQVRQFMNLFSFESNKLELAKMLYDQTVDKQNYGSLTASFSFDVNKEGFKKFLEGK